MVRRGENTRHEICFLGVLSNSRVVSTYFADLYGKSRHETRDF
jgi:hypothetical protein